MHRIDTEGHSGNLFQDASDPKTIVDDNILNAFQEEIANTVEGAGITLVKGTNTQLLDAVMTMVAPIPGGRLTVVPGTPVSTGAADTSASMYYSPYKHNSVVLYNGTRWVGRTFTELSQTFSDATKSPAAALDDTNYDFFVWDDASTIRCTRGPAWSSSSARGTGAGTTELERLNGRWVNKIAITNGPAAQRGLYVGTVRTGTANFADYYSYRGVWNAYNRVPRYLRTIDPTDSWTYSTATIRQSRGISGNQVEFVRGLDEDIMQAKVRSIVASTAAGNATAGIGLDSALAFASGFITSGAGVTASSLLTVVGGEWAGLPGIGRHILTWLEFGVGSGTQTWYGDGGTLVLQSGITATGMF